MVHTNLPGDTVTASAHHLLAIDVAVFFPENISLGVLRTPPGHQHSSASQSTADRRRSLAEPRCPCPAGASAPVTPTPHPLRKLDKDYVLPAGRMNKEAQGRSRTAWNQTVPGSIRYPPLPPCCARPCPTAGTYLLRTANRAVRALPGRLCAGMAPSDGTKCLDFHASFFLTSRSPPSAPPAAPKMRFSTPAALLSLSALVSTTLGATYYPTILTPSEGESWVSGESRSISW